MAKEIDFRDSGVRLDDPTTHFIFDDSSERIAITTGERCVRIVDEHGVESALVEYAYLPTLIKVLIHIHDEYATPKLRSGE
jgi:hypothetical protein